MSYCRWSSDNMRSDVYAYEDVAGGYTVHIRKSRPTNPEILPDFPAKALAEKDIEAVQEWMDKKRVAYPKLVYEDIGLEHDGETMGAESLRELHMVLSYLKGLGYYVPDVTFEMIEDEW